MTATLPEQELAQFFRVPIFMPVDYDGRPMLMTARLANLSQNGCFIATPSPLAVGTKIELRFQLPGVRELIVVSCTVRWSRGSPQSQRPVGGRALGMGLEFDGLSRAQRTHIKSFIRRFITEMRARKS
ncbi:MAG: PilZ domain-containing protein [Deltaproteobacteria bacterium]|nr:PilZ domain-containing protein [Deltaproteobacteria bacterium]